MKIQPNSKVVMIGDSITASQRAQTVEQETREDLGKGYVSFVHGLLTVCYPTHQIQVINRGVPGDTVREMKARWQTDVLDLKPDWLSVCIGINDVWRQYDGKHENDWQVYIDEYEQTVDELVSTVRPTLKGLVLMTPYFLISDRANAMRATTDQYGAVIKKLAGKHQALLVDTQAVIDNALMHLPAATLAWDLAHLYIPGDMLLARAFLKSLDFEW